MSILPPEAPVNYMGDEFRPHFENSANQAPPWHHDDRWWIRYPARLALSPWRGLVRISASVARTSRHASLRVANAWVHVSPYLLADLTHLFCVFAPLGMLSGFRKWSPSLTFVLNCLALPGLDALLNSSSELLGLSFPNVMGRVILLILPSALTLIVSSR
jgi:hypothetical protein